MRRHAFLVDTQSEETFSKSINHDSDEFTNDELESGLITLDMGLMAMSDSDGKLLDEVIDANPLLFQITQTLEQKEDYDP